MLSGCRQVHADLSYKYEPFDNYQTAKDGKTKIVLFSLSNAFELIFCFDLLEVNFKKTIEPNV